MDKLLISLYVPSLQMDFDLFVPENLMIRELIKLLVEGVKDLSGGKYKISGRELLCVKGANILLSENLSLSDYRLRDGERLVLF